MREFARQKSPAFLAFKESCTQALQANPGLRRLDCLNPVKAIPHEFEFTYAPELSLDDAWRQYLSIRYESATHSLGVRDALYDIFAYLRQHGLSLSLPSDVYPVYAMIAASVGVAHDLHATLPRFDVSFVSTDAVLVTAPHVPSGRDLDATEVAELLAWLNASPRRLLIIDRVYDFNNSAVIQPLVDTRQTLVCYSLSKTFLSPLTAGLVIAPPAIAQALEKPLPLEADRAKVLLTKYRELPATQQQIFRYRWDRLRQHVQITPPETGYLAVVPRTAAELREQHGVLAIPGEVYGASNDLSIVSCLHESLAVGDRCEVERFHATTLANFARGFDKYTRVYSKTRIPESTFPNEFYLLGNDLEPGLAKARRLLAKQPSGDRVVVLRTKVQNYELHPNRRTGIGEFVKRPWIEVEALLDDSLAEVQIEDALAEALSLGHLLPWDQVKPRSLSVLPIANACEARCDFCFSHSSVSEDQQQGRIVLEAFEAACVHSASAGAQRLVITGGGEPTLLAQARLLELIRVGKRSFSKVVLISNGHRLGAATQAERQSILRDYEHAGLSVLAISRHSSDNNTAIMKLDTRSELIADSWRSGPYELEMRWICVLQRQGVHDEPTLCKYLDWVAATGVKQVCFKELYVATTQESVYSDTTYNAWCRENQVPLKRIIDFLEACRAQRIHELPWGSPVYRLAWKGHEMEIAAYTEPSVFWERTNGICRSWNLMADGTCYASLETSDSQILLPTAIATN